jgi:hypothetical protein
MKTTALTSILAFLFVAAIGAIRSAEATILTFNIRNAANTSPAPDGFLTTTLSGYGDNVSTTTQAVGGLTYNYNISNGTTPDITVDYAVSAQVAANGGYFKYYGNDGFSPENAFMHDPSTPVADRHFYITLTPATGQGVTLNSFQVYGYRTSVTHTINWSVRAGTISGTILDSGSVTTTGSVTNPPLSTVTPAATVYSQVIVLDLHHSAGGAGALFFDNLSFSQTAVPEPTSYFLISVGSLAFARVVRRRRKLDC